MTPHTGWEDLANHVLRCHLCVDIPPRESGACGLCVGGEVALHEARKILVFDDSISHYAFNHSDRDRVVLILDILRPEWVPPGTCTGGHTNELNKFIDKFK